MPATEDHADLIARERIEALQLRLTEQLAGVRETTRLALDAAEKAVNKAENAADKRFGLLNELRGLVNDLVATLASRDYVDGKVAAIVATLSRLEKADAAEGGRSGISTPLLIGLAVGALSLIGVFTGHVR